MEIDITDFVKTAEPCEFSASAMELGRDAGKITWNNAKREAELTELIGEENRDEFNRWARLPAEVPANHPGYQYRIDTGPC